MPFAERLARQLGEPRGLPGRALAYTLNRGNRSINERAVERLAPDRESSVLEIGFGGGASLAHLLNTTNGLTAGIEISDAMLAHCRRRFRRELKAGRLELARADVTKIPYEDERFDRVLTVQTIYFWTDVHSGLREIHRVLRPKGRLLVATATKEEMDKHAFTEYGFQKFTDNELSDLLNAAGFTDVAVERDEPRVFSSGTKG